MNCRMLDRCTFPAHITENIKPAIIIIFLAGNEVKKNQTIKATFFPHKIMHKIIDELFKLFRASKILTQRIALSCCRSLVFP